MKVRNRLLSEKEYKGRWTEAADEFCPCRRCYNAHDCGYRGSNGKWIERFECATRFNYGCPTRIDRSLMIPIHIIKSKWEFRKKGQTRICKRCGQKVIIGEINFHTVESYQEVEVEK